MTNDDLITKLIDNEVALQKQIDDLNQRIDEMINAINGNWEIVNLRLNNRKPMEETA